MRTRSDAILVPAAPALLPSLASLAGFYFAARLSCTYLLLQLDPQQGALLSLMLAFVERKSEATL